MADHSMLHPSDVDLLSAADREFAAGDAVATWEHIRGCTACANRFAEMQGVLESYVRFHHDVLKPSLPPPAQPWAELRPRLYPRHSRWHPGFLPFGVRAAAGAAVLMLAAMLAWRLGQTPSVSAAALLARAVATESPADAGRNIRIRFGLETVFRPAVLRTEDGGENRHFRALFERAGYSWKAPLSARSYIDWRNRLRAKRDSVQTSTGPGGQRQYLVETSTEEGALHQATLTLEARDLRAISSTLRFRTGEVIEIAEGSERPAAAATGRTGPATPPAKPKTGALARSDESGGPPLELLVVAALHRIGADLGDPIEVERDRNRVLVTATGLTHARRQEIESALGGMPNIVLRFEDALPSSSGRRRHEEHFHPASGNPLAAEAAARLGERVSFPEFVDRSLDLSDAALARAFAVRNLENRFPAGIRDSLALSDRALLKELQQDHLHALASTLDRLTDWLGTAFPQLRTGDAPRQGTTVEDGHLVPAAQELDRLLILTLTGDSAPAGWDARLREALATARASTQAALEQSR